MNQKEITNRVKAALQKDSELMAEVERVKRAKKSGFVAKIWNKIKMSVYAVLGVWLGPDVKDAILEWLGFGKHRRI